MLVREGEDATTLDDLRFVVKTLPSFKAGPLQDPEAFGDEVYKPLKELQVSKTLNGVHVRVTSKGVKKQLARFMSVIATESMKVTVVNFYPQRDEVAKQFALMQQVAFERLARFPALSGLESLVGTIRNHMFLPDENDAYTTSVFTLLMTHAYATSVSQGVTASSAFSVLVKELRAAAKKLGDLEFMNRLTLDAFIFNQTTATMSTVYFECVERLAKLWPEPLLLEDYEEMKIANKKSDAEIEEEDQKTKENKLQEFNELIDWLTTNYEDLTFSKSEEFLTKTERLGTVSITLTLYGNDKASDDITVSRYMEARIISLRNTIAEVFNKTQDYRLYALSYTCRAVIAALKTYKFNLELHEDEMKKQKEKLNEVNQTLEAVQTKLSSVISQLRS
jgi:hypothetical protein